MYQCVFVLCKGELIYIICLYSVKGNKILTVKQEIVQWLSTLIYLFVIPFFIYYILIYF